MENEGNDVSFETLLNNELMTFHVNEMENLEIVNPMNTTENRLISFNGNVVDVDILKPFQSVCNLSICDGDVTLIPWSPQCGTYKQYAIETSIEATTPEALEIERVKNNYLEETFTLISQFGDEDNFISRGPIIKPNPTKKTFLDEYKRFLKEEYPLLGTRSVYS